LRDRIRATFVAAVTTAALLLAAAPTPASAAGFKVAIIVGPTGAQTDNYREDADDVYAAAVGAGATAVKVYSPNATWANVRAAVSGANIIVWMGHGNGYPNPYNATETTSKVNGWGLNRTTTNGDGDNYSTQMIYCGEKALLGTLTSSDADQWRYCGGSTSTDGIHPAAGFVMVYAHACYTAGAGEPGEATQPESTYLSRVMNYSTPPLRLGATAYYATTGAGASIVSSILSNPTTSYGDIFRANRNFTASALRTFAHADVPGNSIWLQNDGYHYAFAGDPNGTPGGAGVIQPPTAFPARLDFGEGTHTGYKFGSSGQLLAKRTYTLSRASGASASSLRPIANQSGEWFSVINGVWAGYWIRQSDVVHLSGDTIVIGTLDSRTFNPVVRLAFKEGTHTGYKFNASGALLSERSYTLSHDSGAATSKVATISRQSGSWFYVVNGVWAGYWLRASDVLYLE
jgi:hypothetical protein